MAFCFADYERSAQALRAKIGDFVPQVALILGSGLGELGDHVESPICVSYEDIPHFRRSTTLGHKGRLVFGTLEGRRVAVMQGRIHYYEGYSLEEVDVYKRQLLVSSRFVRDLSLNNPLIKLVIFLAVIIAVLYWFFGTETGCSLRATGANGNMARAQGINTNFAKVLGLMISNGLVALSGGLLAQYQGFSDINMGRGAIVIGLAAVIIGEVIFEKVFRNFALKLVACVIGAIIYYIVIQFVLKLGLSTDDLKLLTALVVMLFLAIPYWKGRYFNKPGKKGAQSHA